MPLGERLGDKSDSRYCGVECDFNDDMPQLLSLNINGGFDFVLATLMEPTYRPSLVNNGSKESGVLPFAGSDLVISPSQWSSHVVGKISSWIDLDSEDETLRKDSEITLKQEIAWASHLSLQACLLPTPKGASCGNYARCVNQILQSLSNMQLWLRIPLEKSDDDDDVKGPSDHMDPQNPTRNRGFAFIEYYNNACADYSRQKMSSPNFKLDGNTPTVTWADPKSSPDHSAAAQMVSWSCRINRPKIVKRRLSWKTPEGFYSNHYSDAVDFF